MPVTGPMIAVVPESSSFKVLVDGSGLGNVDEDRLFEHKINEAEMWIGSPDDFKNGIVFSLPEEQMLESIAVWNYNRPAYTDLGVQKMDVSVWTEKDGWKTVLKDAVIEEAEGSDDYDEPTIADIKTCVGPKSSL